MLVPASRHIEDRVVQRRLAGRDAHRLHAAFEGGDAAVEHVGRRVADPAVAVAGRFEIEQGGAMLGAVEFIGGGLIDRHRNGAGRWVAVITAVHGDGFRLHLEDLVQ